YSAHHHPPAPTPTPFPYTTLFRSRKRGTTFYGCSRYPKCDFTSANKPIPEKCPQCGHEYLVLKYTKDGPVIACPNKKVEGEEAPKKRRGKKPAAEEKPSVKCDYSRPAPEEAIPAPDPAQREASI